MGNGALQLCRPININTAGGGEMKEWGQKGAQTWLKKEGKGAEEYIIVVYA